MFNPFDPTTWHDAASEEQETPEKPTPKGESWVFDSEEGQVPFEGPFSQAIAEIAKEMQDELPVMLGYWPQPGPMDATTHFYTLTSLAVARAVREGFLPETLEWENVILDLLEAEFDIVVKGEILNLFLPQKDRLQVLKDAGREP